MPTSTCTETAAPPADPATPVSAPDATTGVPPRLLLTLALLTGIAPFATDMYLSSFPEMAADLGTSASGIQATLMAFLVGLALGQLVIGPVSDQRGRRRLLLLGTAVAVLASIGCALAPSVGVLVAARFVQGLAGAAGIVLARAVVTDVARGAAVARAYSMLMVVQGVAPVVAPLVGSALAVAAGWRSVFWVLAALCAVMFVASLVVVHETHPEHRRASGGAARLRADIGTVLRDRAFVAYLLTFVFAFGAFFAYISASPFVLQTMLGLTTGQYSLAFAVNALGIMVASAAAGQLVDRVGARRLVRVGGAIMLVASVGLLALAATGSVTLWPVLVAFFLLVVALGLIAGNATMLAMQQVPEASGSASAVLGSLQFLLAAAAAPLVGVGGAGTALPMALTMTVCSVVVVASLVAAARRDARTR
jgi:DHA1 family bicyclomycin/chloramphenicol resistance-like MFS transporter